MLDNKQLKKIARLAKIADKGEVAIIEELDSIDEQLEALQGKVESALSISSKAKNGIQGVQGVQGKNGEKGKDGVNGKNGENGEDGLNGVNGVNGANGKAGKDGKNGRSPLIGWGAHPLRVEQAGVMKTKVARTLNFKGTGVPTITQNANGTTELNFAGGTGFSGELLDSTSTAIAVVLNGLIISTYFTPAAGFLLQEDGFFILQENGDKIIL